MRDQIGVRDDWTCVYCGRRASIVDHVYPRRHGGKAILENGVIACASCNQKKGGRLDVRYITIAFKHLLEKGANLGWTDTIRKGSVPDVRPRVRKKKAVAKILPPEVPRNVAPRPPRAPLAGIYHKWLLEAEGFELSCPP